jgi:hypothetical protein
MQAIVERIEKEAGVPGLAAILAERLAPTDLQSLLLAVYRQRSSQRRAADVLCHYESDRFVRPATVSPRRLLAWEQAAFASLPAQFEPLALSPVCPLGSSAVVASTDQNWAVATARNTEVVSDSTNVLALECAVRRRKRLALTDWNAPARTAMIEAQLLAPLQSEFPTVNCVVDDQRTSGRGYYRDLCFHIDATNRSGQALELVDGGSVDWSQRLLGSAKERLVISGIGSERLCGEF